MFDVKQVPVFNFILLIFACFVLRKVHVHSLFALEAVSFPGCLLFLDSDIKRLINNAVCCILAISVHRLSEKYEKIISFVFIFHIVF